VLFREAWSTPTGAGGGATTGRTARRRLPDVEPIAARRGAILGRRVRSVARRCPGWDTYETGGRAEEAKARHGLLGGYSARKSFELKGGLHSPSKDGRLTTPYGPAPEAVRIRASLTSKLFLAPLRQATNDAIQSRAVSYVLNQHTALTRSRNGANGSTVGSATERRMGLARGARD